MRTCDYADDDLPAVAALFTASIHALAVAHYDAGQRAAWAPRPPDLAEWRYRLAGLQVRLAEADGALAGFIGFTGDGHIDLLYTAPEYARQGVAAMLYDETERRLAASGARVLCTEASLVAAPFFSRQGFTVVARQCVMRRGVSFLRYAMRKTLDG